MRTTNIRHDTVEVNGARLALDETGEGPVVVQLHGMGSSRGSDRELGFDFSSLVTTHRLVRYDARGHGDSDGKADPTHYTWAHLALDLLAVKAHVSPGAPVDAIGASMGSGTILHAALAVPEAFRRLVLLIPPTAWETRVAQAREYEALAVMVEKHGLQAFLEPLRNLPRPPASPRTDLELQGSADLFSSVVRGGALTDLPPADDLRALTCPTLILPWADDPGHPLSTAERLAEILPDATLEPPATSPDEVRAWGSRVAGFLR